MRSGAVCELLEQADEQSSSARTEELGIIIMIIIVMITYVNAYTSLKTVTKQLAAFPIRIFQAQIHPFIPMHSSAQACST